MAICSGCGGVVGRDCFNPQECEWIARDQERRYMMEQAQAAAAEAVADAIPPGVPMRDYFAAKAIQGLLANPGGPIQANGMNGWNWCNCSPEDAVNLAYSMADAMLAARENKS